MHACKTMICWTSKRDLREKDTNFLGMKMKKVIIFSLKTCYRSICNHLCLVGFFFLLALLFRTNPFIFSMLVSSSPVIASTLALLGTLLNLGSSEIPEIELDNRARHEPLLLKAAFLDDGIVDVEEKLTLRTSEIVSDISKVSLDGSFGQLVDKISQDKVLDDMEERLADKRVDDNQYSLIMAEDIDDDDEHLHQENDDECSVGSINSTEVNVEYLDSLPGSPWKYANEKEGCEDYCETMGCGYDRVEGSSPVASVADITPILDELNPLLDRVEGSYPDASVAGITPKLDELDPLLDEDPSQSANSSLDESCASSELSFTSNDSSSVLDDDLDDQQELLVTEDDDEDGEDEEEVNEHKEGQITWTEEDQKNLMDIRTSELQRNQRLEKVIATRRAQRSLSMRTERNLIDLDASDIPFNVPPISTTRTGLLELLEDSSENKGLLSIPGSAPTILLPRIHPFDILYDLSEEKPDLTGGIFKQEFMPLLPKDPFFHKHDSSNVQPSSFGISRIEKKASSRFRRQFVSERLGSEEASYSPICGQSSEVSATEEKTSFIDDEYDVKTSHTDDTAHKEYDHDSSPSTAVDPQVDSDLDSSAMMVLVILWLLQNPQKSSVMENLPNEEEKPYEGAFEPSLSVEECVREVNRVEKEAISSAVLHTGVTKEDKSAINIANEVDTSRDVEEYDVKETMPNAVGDTTEFGIKTPDAVMWVDQMLVTRKKIQ